MSDIEERFLVQRNNRLRKQLRKLQNQNRKLELTRVMYESLVNGQGVSHLSTNDLIDLAWLVDETLEHIKNRIDALKGA